MTFVATAASDHRTKQIRNMTSSHIHSDSDLPRPDPYAPPDEILAATAHELRLPVTHIKSFVSSLLRADVDWDQETRLEFFAEIDTETDRLAELIDALLAMRSGAGLPNVGRCQHD